MNDLLSFDEYLNDKQIQYSIEDPNYRFNISRFLVSNNWFNQFPTIQNNELFFDKESLQKVDKKIDEFCENYNKDEKDKINVLFDKLDDILPKTSNFLQKYIKNIELDEKISLTIADFIYSFLPGELDESTDVEIASLLDTAFDELPHVYGTVLTDFINWTHDHTKTLYKNLYYMNNYTNHQGKNSAYDPQSYLSILYHLYNQNYIEQNDMYTMAAESKNYVDTWLFLSMHFLCALRNTDLLRIPHPRLTDTPEIVLEQIKNSTFSKASAKSTIYSVLWELEALMLTPNKTQGTSGVATIKLHIPESVEEHIGTLFAAAEAHSQLSNSEIEKPLLRVITTYEQINRYMGEDIGNLFLESNFLSKAANKSYMQMIYLLTDDILETNDEFRVKGYMLAALARSHKGSYGEFAKTTSVYLKDAKMSGYTPEFVARELFERGVLSVIPSMLLKMVAKDDYNKLSIENQTKMIQELNMSPMEIETVVSVMQKNMKQSTEIVKSIYQGHSTGEILNILHSIGNGEAVSKIDSCMCLITAMGKVCPHPECSNCIACEYELSTKSTMFLMVREVIRLQNIYLQTNNTMEKQKSKSIVKNMIAPRIEEMLSIIEEKYGHDAIKALENIITREKHG